MKKTIAFLLLNIIIFSMTTTCVQAIESTNISQENQSQDYKNYSLLSEDEQRKYEVVPETVSIPEYSLNISNPIKAMDMVSANASSSSKYLLSEDIPENVTIKDQLTLSNCWVFSALASLETNLALANKRNNKPAKVYDFSEKHLDYSLTRNYFNNNEINKYGLNRQPGSAGNWQMAMAYLTTGQGAVDESSMPYDDRKEKIDLSELRNAPKTSDVQNMKYYPSITDVTENSIAQIKSILKTDIKINGGISSKVHFPNEESEFYNALTGALYCSDSNKIVDHALTIVGWDDDYETSNFNTSHTPSSPGAWIAKNSWGTESSCSLQDFKETLYSIAKDQFNQQGINSASEITDTTARSLIEQLDSYGVRVDGSTVYYPMGDDGYIYISYEDKKVYQNLMGIVDATEQKDYDNIYYYDEVGWSNALKFGENHIYLGNVFTKKGSDTEKLTKVGLATIDKTICKVYVNPNGKSMSKSDLKQVELDNGNSAEIDAGYHTLKLKEPITINSNEFAVVIEITGNNTEEVRVVGESPVDNELYSNVELESNKCFISLENSFNQNEWIDLSKLSEIQSTIKNIDSTIKAYTSTTSAVTTPSLQRIEVTTQPLTLQYEEGMNFNSDGLVVTAFYDNNTSKQITNYEIKDGNNLKKGQDKITISYEGKTAFVNISVSEKNTQPNTAVNDTTTNDIDPNTQVNETATNNIGPNTQVNETATNNIGPNTQVNEIATNNIGPNTQVNDITTNNIQPNTQVNDIATNNIEPNTQVNTNQTDNNQINTPQVEPEVTDNEIPINTNFNNLKSELIEVSTINGTMKVKIRNFFQNKSNDSLEYSYYLSSKTSIPTAEFIKADDAIVQNNSLTFTIKLEDVPNIDELNKASGIYLFIKEKATKGTKYSEVTSNALQFSFTSNSKIDNKPVTEISNIEYRSPSSLDDTVAKDPIPQTGMKSIIGIIVATFVIGLLLLVKYIKIKNK